MTASLPLMADLSFLIAKHPVPWSYDEKVKIMRDAKAGIVPLFGSGSLSTTIDMWGPGIVAAINIASGATP